MVESNLGSSCYKATVLTTVHHKNNNNSILKCKITLRNESFEKKNSTFIDIIKQSHNGLRILSIDISVEDFLYEYISARLCNMCTNTLAK